MYLSNNRVSQLCMKNYICDHYLEVVHGLFALQLNLGQRESYKFKGIIRLHRVSTGYSLSCN